MRNSFLLFRILLRMLFLDNLLPHGILSKKVGEGFRMNHMERADQAAELRRCGMCNCCQAVLTSLADQTGLSQAELMAAGSGFAVGMGNMEATCGALIGAVIAAGFKLSGQGTVRYARQLSDDFRTRCGATLCKELKGRDSGTPLCPCEDCVRNAVLSFGSIVGVD